MVAQAILVFAMKQHILNLKEDNAEAIIRDEVGAVFERVLCDAGVFKRDKAGTQAFRRFIGTLL